MKPPEHTMTDREEQAWMAACEEPRKRLRERSWWRGLLGAKPRLTRYTWEDIHDLADEYTFEAARDVIKDFADWLHMRDDE